MPFSLLGGSSGGITVSTYGSNPYFHLCCDLFGGLTPGGPAGGTLAVLAGGNIDIDGVVDVRGGTYGSIGSAGSLLLRADGNTLLRPSGQLLAITSGTVGAGEVRLDAWGSAPVVQGSISAPAPVVVALPYLRALAAPAIGTAWSIEVFARPSTVVFLAASTGSIPSTATPFGSLELDLASGDVVAMATSSTGIDPAAAFAWSVPNAPQLIGLPLWLQGLAWPAALPPRLTNAVSAIVQ
jgi:hypothetical protein